MRSAPSARTRWPLVVLAVTVAALAAGAPAQAEVNADTAVSPVCANPDMAYWNAHAADYVDSLEGSTRSDLQLHVNYQVGVGAMQKCAFQSRQESFQVCTGPGGGLPCHAEYKYVPGVPVTAFPDTIDAAGGDGQTVTIKAPGTTNGYMDSVARVTWGSCFPGATYQPGLCTPSLFRFEPGGFVASGGQMLYRYRDETGTFRGPWTLSYGKLSPGFRLEHTSTTSVCDKFAAECGYQVIFQRDPLNKPVVGRDVQVLLLLVVHEGVYPNDASHDVAVPMLIVQSGGGDASGVGNGGTSGTPTPEAGPPTAGGGPGTPVSTPPAGSTSPPTVPAASKITFTGGAPKLGPLAKAGALKAKVPVADAGVHVRGVLTITAAQAKALGVAVPKGAKTVTIGSASVTTTGAGDVTLSISLTSAARSALRRAARHRRPASVKATLTLTFTGPGGTAAPVTKPVTIGR